MSKRRVVVTGLGLVTPVGNDVETSWSNILAGVSGAAPVEAFDTDGFGTRFSCSVKDFDVTEYMPAKDARKMDDFIHFGMAAGIQAIRDSGIDSLDNLDPERVGVAIGSGIGGLPNIEAQKLVLNERGPRKISPFFIPSSIINMISGNLSIRYGFQGPNYAIVTACTTGTHNIGDAARTIAYGDADVMVAGGAEMATSPLGLAGAVARGAHIYCELAGYGMSGDAYHMTQPAENGDGARRCMVNALRDGGINPEEVGYINAHGTSTPAGDVAETEAVKGCFGEHARQLLVSSTKSMTGHLLGAAGGIEAVFSVLALRDKVAPPTINLDDPDPACDLNFVPHEPRALDTDVALSNSFGFGGTNGTVVFRRV